jgi:predicted RNase H-like HicB family nuclease
MTPEFICWQSGKFWLGYLEGFPDYWTQGVTRDELTENLKELYRDLSAGESCGLRSG